MEKVKLAGGVVGIILLVVFLYQQNNKLQINKITVAHQKLPAEFNGFKIVHLSDLHNKWFGPGQKRLITKLKQLEPDLIAVTGDLVDESGYDQQAAVQLLQEAQKLAPVYLVTGNNDLGVEEWPKLSQKIKEIGVKLLTEEKEQILADSQSIRLIGIGDPGSYFMPQIEVKNRLNNKLAMVCRQKSRQEFTILLVHRPQFLALYNSYHLDLVLAGHAHGGQVRLPLLGGLIAPGQGLLPKYTAGLHTYQGTKLVINRGLGNSIIPQRLFNRPEIGVINLTKQ